MAGATCDARPKRESRNRDERETNPYVVHASFGRSTGSRLAGNPLVFVARLAFPGRTVFALAMDGQAPRHGHARGLERDRVIERACFRMLAPSLRPPWPAADLPQDLDAPCRDRQPGALRAVAACPGVQG